MQGAIRLRAPISTRPQWHTYLIKARLVAFRKGWLRVAVEVQALIAQSVPEPNKVCKLALPHLDEEVAPVIPRIDYDESTSEIRITGQDMCSARRRVYHPHWTLKADIGIESLLICRSGGTGVTDGSKLMSQVRGCLREMKLTRRGGLPSCCQCNRHPPAADTSCSALRA